MDLMAEVVVDLQETLVGASDELRFIFNDFSDRFCKKIAVDTFYH
jgi:hypothetical protein